MSRPSEAKRARRAARIAARTPEQEGARQEYWARVKERGARNIHLMVASTR